MISWQNIRHTYDGNTEIALADAALKDGDQVAIIGQSGTGKTTLLHILAGILQPKSGSIQIDQKDITALKNAELDKFRGKNIGIVFQKPHFIQSLTVTENLQLAQTLAGKSADSTRVEQLLNKLNLAGRGNKKPRYLSQGEQQRVSIARAVINQPKIILADEPTSSLDDVNCHEVIDLLQTTASENKAALVVVTHDQRVKSKFEKIIAL